MDKNQVCRMCEAGVELQAAIENKWVDFDTRMVSKTVRPKGYVNSSDSLLVHVFNGKNYILYDLVLSKTEIRLKPSMQYIQLTLDGAKITNLVNVYDTIADFEKDVEENGAIANTMLHLVEFYTQEQVDIYNSYMKEISKEKVLEEESEESDKPRKTKKAK